MVKIITEIRKALLKVCSSVYTTEVKNKSYPYITLKFDTDDTSGMEETYNLEINVWDKDTDILDIENLTEDIIRELRKFVYIDVEEGYLIHTGYRGRYTLEDPVEDIQRRLIRYKVITDKTERRLRYYE